MPSMVEFQFNRRMELLRNPYSAATGIRTAGVGSSGNDGHLNLTTPLLTFPKQKRSIRPRQLRRAAIVSEMASLGCGQFEASIILGVESSTVHRICKRFGIEMRGRKGPKPWLRSRILRDYRHGVTPTLLAEKYGTSAESVRGAISRLKASGAIS